MYTRGSAGLSILDFKAWRNFITGYWASNQLYEATAGVTQSLCKKAVNPCLRIEVRLPLGISNVRKTSDKVRFGK